LDARHHEVQDRIRALTAELDLLRAEASALHPAWNCLQGWVGVSRVYPVPDPAEEEAAAEPC
jgi:hypothetical protein